MGRTLASLVLLVFAPAGFAEEPTARIGESHGYARAVILENGNARAVLCPEAGGRVLEFSVGGKNVMWFDEAERNRKPGSPASSAGRFDFGPELTTAPHPKIWLGAWTAEIRGECGARLTSQKDEATGVQVVRDFELTSAAGREVAPSLTRRVGESASRPMRLVCRQTITNVSSETKEYCHWGRSFSPGGGICLIPLAGQSRFPNRYVMYEEGATINARPTDDNIRERGGFLEILAPPRRPKLGFDSYAGWLAYAMPGDVLFVKKFATYPDRVYSEAAGLTISVWYPPGARIELEPIGPRERLAPGESASFTEEWFVLTHPFPQPGESIDIAQLRKKVTAELGIQ